MLLLGHMVGAPFVKGSVPLRRIIGLAVLSAFTALPISAATVSPDSYSMQNGGSGSYNYWDDSYTGSGSLTTNYSALSGGTGDLTDGIIAPATWNITEAPAGAGPYVGWLNRNPLISFFFDQVYVFNTLTIHYDNSGLGGVARPSSIQVAGMSFTLPAEATGGTGSFTANLGGVSADRLDLLVVRTSNWVFLSEVSFDVEELAPVPLPASGLALLAGLGGLAAARRRKQAA